MKNNFDIYLFGLEDQQSKPLIDALQDHFDIHSFNNTDQDLSSLKKSILVIFDHRLDKKILKLHKKFLEKNTPLIAYINSIAEPESTKISLLEEGIDDIILFEMSDQEKVARIKKIIQIYLQTTKKMIKVSDLILDNSVQVATYKSDNLHLSKTEFHILYTLFENYKIEITRDKLARKIWKKQLSNNLNKHLSNLKKKIESTPIEIISRRGQGISVQLRDTI